MFRYIFTNVPANEINMRKTGIVAIDGGTLIEERKEGDGNFTLVADFPGDPPPEELPGNAPGVPWLAVAQAEIGVTEGGNPRITEYFSTTSLGEQPDSVPWCSAFVNFCVTRSGNKGTKSALARSWLQWGEDCPEFIPGCVVVLSRGGPNTGHVGFYVGRDPKGAIQLLGGNQHNSVNISAYSEAQVLGRRILAATEVKAPLSPAPTVISPIAGPALDEKGFLIKAMNDQGLTDNTLRAGIAAIAAVESGFRARSELSYRNTRPERLRLLFGDRVADLDDATLAALSKDDEAFFNKVYGGTFGRAQLGNTEPGDGFRFRGRGIFQLTGRSNYQRYGTMVSTDLLMNADLANDAALAAQLAVAYMRDRFKGGNFSAMKRVVGHSTADIDQRKNDKFAEFQSSHEFDA